MHPSKALFPRQNFFLIAALFALSVGSISARTFTDVTGKKIEAELVKVEGDTVIIRMAGKEFPLPIAKFSAEDQKFIRESAPASVSPGTTSAVSSDERVKPGATFFLEFPDLAPDRHDAPTKMQVTIPTTYDPAKKVPLVVWMEGGDGSNTNGTAQAIVDSAQFVCVGLPFPKGANNPNQANMVGDYKSIWKYHKTMLDALIKVVPNIEPRLRIVGGFSNGAHAIDGILDEGKGYTDYFNVFVLVDGGGHSNSWPKNGNQFACVLWGETSPANALGQNNRDLAKRAKMEFMAEEMKGVGHAFPEEYRPKVKDWIMKTVMPKALAATPPPAK
ncbi:MAG: hypothetical protein RL693_147 [Verrucomicrobiota bacterium]|jgi:hypothetical protein